MAEQIPLFRDLPIYLGAVTKHPAYSVWRGMITRCHNPNYPEFHLYGGRGIRVCEEWRKSSRAFVAWAIKAGYEPGLQIDRKNNNRGYNPRNCHFVTPRENQNNRRDTRRLSDGTPLADAARILGINYHMVRSRIYDRGWNIDDAVSIPAGGKRPLPEGFKSVGDAAASVVAATVANIAQGEGRSPAQRVALGDEAQRPAIPRGLLDLPCPNLDRPSYHPGYPAEWLAKGKGHA